MCPNEFKPLLLEFVGLPGSGKTTVVEALAIDLSKQGMVAVTKHDLHRWRASKSRFFNLTLVFRNPLTSLRHTLNLLRFSQSLDERVALKRLMTGALLNFQLTAFAEETKFDIMLLDQGALQNLWSIAAFSSKFDDLLLHQCVADACELDAFNVLYINVLATPELSAHRISLRKTNDSRFDLMEANVRQRSIQRACGLMSFIFNELNILPRKALRLNAEDDVLINLTSISKKINECFIHNIL